MKTSKGIKEIGIFAVGMTPQIITETIFALAGEAVPPVTLEEVHVITTTTGKRRLRERLLESGIWQEFLAEYELPPIRLDDETIHVVTDPAGTPLEDLRGCDDNEAMGDLICRIVEKFASRPRTRLHGSIAGGRKTMSYYLGSAFQLYARPEDRLYHVLVTPEFESHPDFFYIPRKHRVLEKRDGCGKVIGRLNTRDARIDLADLPFVRLRRQIPLAMKSFRELVAEGQEEIDTAYRPEKLSVNLQEHSVQVGEEIIDLVPMQLLIYFYLLREKVQSCRYPDQPYCFDCTDCFPTINELSLPETAQEMLLIYRRMFDPLSARVDRFQEKHGKDGLDPGVIRQNISKLNRIVREHFRDDRKASHYVIDSVGGYGSRRYGIRLEKGKIGQGGERRNDE